MDCAKIIAAGAFFNGDPWDLMKNPSLITKSLPVGAILTRPSNGAETSSYAYILNRNLKEKRYVENKYLTPEFAIVDPMYTLALPMRETKNHIMSLLCQIFEIYLYDRKYNTFLQYRMAEALFKTTIHYTKILMTDPGNYEARATLTWIGCLGISGLTKNRIQNNWSVHVIENELEAAYDIPHGEAMSIIAPQWMRLILEEDTVQRFFEYSVNVWGCDRQNDMMQNARKGIEKTEDFFANVMKMPRCFEDLGIEDTFFPEIVKKVFEFSPDHTVGRTRPLSEEDVYLILLNSL